MFLYTTIDRCLRPQKIPRRHLDPNVVKPQQQQTQPQRKRVRPPRASAVTHGEEEEPPADDEVVMGAQQLLSLVPTTGNGVKKTTTTTTRMDKIIRDLAHCASHRYVVRCMYGLTLFELYMTLVELLSNSCRTLAQPPRRRVGGHHRQAERVRCGQERRVSLLSTFDFLSTFDTCSRCSSHVVCSNAQPQKVQQFHIHDVRSIDDVHQGTGRSQDPRGSRRLEKEETATAQRSGADDGCGNGIGLGDPDDETGQ